ncbi:tannase and feruloyl esterase [Aulographum hederae CBS 113979]|uniref:Carboxylic ester hydrolase n=1 Tax=Aulographum hederae CBS 113979 TaxID=1176131 RepID=A0A6G1GV56_9PEZI|nr:tannase and feruloyl esterase [Aulographum hederae CBS 113979]
MFFAFASVVCWLASIPVQASPRANPPSYHNKRTQRDDACTSLHLNLTVPDFTLLSSSATPIHNFSVPGGPGPDDPPLSNLSFCNFTAILTHASAADYAFVTIWLPFDGWNGRFLATGGGGLLAGYNGSLPLPLSQGYATGFTDAGLSRNGTIEPSTGLWVLKRKGVVDHDLVENFASRSVHDMTVVGKEAVKAFYEEPAHHSYYTGCSTGGRQGYFAAHYYPHDYDGILANAPNLYTPRSLGGLYWLAVVMGNSVAPPNCVFAAYQSAIVAACDGIDGAVDGTVSRPWECGNITITPTFADVVASILRGARAAPTNISDSGSADSWCGIPPSAPFTTLANTTTSPSPFINGNFTTVPTPFSAAAAWLRLFVLKDADADITNLSYHAFDALWRRGQEYPYATIQFRRDLQKNMQPEGGKQQDEHEDKDKDKHEEIKSYYRLFLAPGVGHCGGGTGPTPTDDLGALVRWVEQGEVPERLQARGMREDGGVVERGLCVWPSVERYEGGDVFEGGVGGVRVMWRETAREVGGRWDG